MAQKKNETVIAIFFPDSSENTQTIKLSKNQEKQLDEFYKFIKCEGIEQIRLTDGYTLTYDGSFIMNKRNSNNIFNKYKPNGFTDLNGPIILSRTDNKDRAIDVDLKILEELSIMLGKYLEDYYFFERKERYRLISIFDVVDNIDNI